MCFDATQQNCLQYYFKLPLLLVCLLSFQLLSAEEIRVAVASNFTATIKTLAKNFEAQTSHKVILIFGATGRHYAQIKNGAPFDIFFAADSEKKISISTPPEAQHSMLVVA